MSVGRVGWGYVLSALVSPILLWLFGNVDPRFLGYTVRYEIVPLGVIALALAATRWNSVAPLWLEICAVVLWCGTQAMSSVYYPLFNSADRVGSAACEGMAIVFGGTGLAMGILAGVALVSFVRGRSYRSTGQLLAAMGMGTLAVYLVAVSTMLYSAGRRIPGGGLDAINHAMVARVATTIIVALTLALSGLLAWRKRAHHGA